MKAHTGHNFHGRYGTLSVHIGCTLSSLYNVMTILCAIELGDVKHVIVCTLHGQIISKTHITLTDLSIISFGHCKVQR